MGLFDRLQQRMERSHLERSHASQRRRVGDEWRAWAAEHGFEYDEERPDLVGRWLPPVAIGTETYWDVLSGPVRGRDVVAFVRQAVRDRSLKRDTYDEICDAYVMARLPRAPSRSVLERGADRLIGDFGIHLRDNYRAEFIGSEWLALYRPGFHDPRRLALHTDLLVRMIIDAPSTLWSDT
jgi:hypothetical protein